MTGDPRPEDLKIFGEMHLRAVARIETPDQLAGLPDYTLYRSAESAWAVWMKFAAPGGYHWLDMRSPGDSWHTDAELPMPGYAWPPHPVEES